MKDVGNLKGGGVTIRPNLPNERSKKMLTWGRRGVGQKLENITESFMDGPLRNGWLLSNLCIT